MNIYINGTITVKMKQTASQLVELAGKLTELAKQPAGAGFSAQLSAPDVAKEVIIAFEKID